MPTWTTHLPCRCEGQEEANEKRGRETPAQSVHRSAQEAQGSTFSLVLGSDSGQLQQSQDGLPPCPPLPHCLPSQLCLVPRVLIPVGLAPTIDGKVEPAAELCGIHVITIVTLHRTS